MSHFWQALLYFLRKNKRKILSICIGFLGIYLLYTKIIPNFNPTPAGFLIILFIIGCSLPALFPSNRGTGEPKPPNINHDQSQSPPPQRSESQIRDHTGNLRANIVTDGNRSAIYDYTGRYCGYYDSNTNFTYDHTGRIVAQGNVLSTLVKF